MDEFREGQVWPFPIAKPENEWNEHERDHVNLMRVAYAERYHPRVGPVESIDLGEWPHGRSVKLIRRGFTNGLEPCLADCGRYVCLGPLYGLKGSACVCVRPPFRNAAYLALSWMRGLSLEALLRDFKFVGGSPPGIALRRDLDVSGI
jgi:hypothetical protein